MSTKNSKFKIILFTKRFIFLLEKYLDNIPNRRRVLKDNINNASYSLLKNIYLANILDRETFGEKRRYLESVILSDISMLDFFLEDLYRNKYISEKNSLAMSSELEQIRIWVRGWINSEKSNDQRFK